MPINSSVLKHVDKDRREEFKTYFDSITEIRDTLIAMCEEEVETLLSTKGEDYDKGSWAYYQADKNGQLKVWKQMLTIMKYKQDK